MARVLLVDDQSAVSEAAGRLLRSRGYSVTIAWGCDEARLLSVGSYFHIGLIGLPLQDGRALGCALMLRRLGVVEDLVFLTGGAAPEAIEAARRMGPVIEKHAFQTLLRTLAEVRTGGAA